MYIVQTVIYTHDSGFTELKPSWNLLRERSYASTLFSTWEWLATWWSVYQPGDLFIVAVYDASELIGIAPWYINQRNKICGIGCVDVTDYYDLIIREDRIADVMQCFCDVLIESSQLDGICLCNIPAASPTLRHLSNHLQKHQFAIHCDELDVCPIITLPASWSEYLQQLDKKQRHEIRRKLRRAFGAGVDINHYTVNETHDLAVEMDHFFALMAASDPEKAGFLEDPYNVDFFKRISRIAHDKGWLQLDFLKFNDQYVSAYFNFRFNNRLYVYNSGLSYESYGHLSPGIVLLSRVIENAIEEGMEAVDFLRGDEQYKYRMGGKDTHVYSLAAALTSRHGA